MVVLIQNEDKKPKIKFGPAYKIFRDNLLYEQMLWFSVQFTMQSLLGLAVLLASVVCTESLGTIQSASAKGKLLCNGKPLGKVLVKLFDDDRGKLIFEQWPFTL